MPAKIEKFKFDLPPFFSLYFRYYWDFPPQGEYSLTIYGFILKMCRCVDVLFTCISSK